MESWRRKKEKGKARKCFLRNGSVFLEELITDCNGISNPIRMFSSDQISEATNQFDPKCSLADDGCFTYYKGDIEDRPYTMKMYTDNEEAAYNDIVLSARVSNHSCFLKLIGCCLEYPLPVLVFENLEYGALNRRGSVGCHHDGPLLPWNVRLKIAKEVAIAITYLHTAFPRIIIHRDIKATNVFLDKNGKAKLSNLSLSVSLPEGKSWIEDQVVGTNGYIDPVYCMTCVVSEYIDVFSFGILMLVLLIGDPPHLYGSDLCGPNGERFINWKFLEYVRDLHERGEPIEFGGDPNDIRPDQMEMFLELALRCCEESNEDRPKMIMVAKEINLIEQGSFDCSEMLENETNCLLKHGSMSHQQLIADSNQISEATSHLDPKCYLGKEEEEETLRSKLMDFWRRRKKKGKARKCFLRNGSMFLEKLIADCNGISNPIKMFSSDQISKATDDPKCSILDASTYFTWYKGVIEGRPYLIKICTRENMGYNDTVLSARVSNHSGFPKLIGSCLEYPLPVLVFEDLDDYRVLNERGSIGSEDAPLLPWNVRLKIAKEVAIAITYLHTAFPRIIIHRHIKPTNVLLDKNGKAKLTDFWLAVTLPEGKSWIEEPIAGTIGYLDPNYYKTNIVTEYSDVFSFGTLMLVLLAGRPPILNGADGDLDLSDNIVEYVKDLHERGEPVGVGGDSYDMNPVQMKVFLDLALRCWDRRSEDRPKMIVVAKEIKLIEKVPFDCSQMLENVSEDGQTKH
ncbi:uncharacterized protein LOC125578469 [Brassica napus]|uniref:uncharacterized protein LOC125578469 n=1 Tax=Brassica napus TaxID=3708 RepID=UPI00207898B4|nr:uncharacterized protein LOC125578469 [Brassica napus]